MATIDENTDILEEFEPLLEARAAAKSGNHQVYERLLQEIEQELGDEYVANIHRKIERWLEVTVVQYFYDRRPVQFYFQAKMLYRDGFYEAAIMLCRSISEMICYERLDGIAHPFGNLQQIEKKNFRDLIKWLHSNDPSIDIKVHNNLNALYDIGNNYVHPKTGFSAPADALNTLHLIGEALYIVYGIKDYKELMGHRIRAAYIDFPDINSGQNLLMTVFATPSAAAEHQHRHGTAF